MKTYCVAIEKDINTNVCPLQPGVCYWQHRDTHNCKYTAEDITPEQFSSLVGLVVPPDYVASKIAELKTKLTQ